MPWTGTGQFHREYNWTQDAEHRIGINPERMDREFDNFKAGLENCLTKTGETRLAANQSMAGFKHTSVGKAAKRDEYLSVAQLQDGEFIWGGVSEGARESYKIKLAGTPTHLKAGQVIRFQAHKANEGECFLKVDAIEKVKISHQDGSDLKAADIAENSVVSVVFDGVNFQVMPQQKVTAEEITEKFDGLAIMPIGGIIPFAGEAAPEGWLICNGQVLNADQDKQFKALFDVIGTHYGGEGQYQFAIPDLRGRSPFGLDDESTDRLSADRSGVDGTKLGTAGGADVHQMTIDEMPSHDHDYQCATANVNGNAQGGAFATTLRATKSGKAGADKAHNNMPPCLVMNYIIRY